ncbi:MAG: hypothetical protein JWP97_6410 [Labilithrix sp.]|nr:hypothetical protein [Labilithrix sp.]
MSGEDNTAEHVEEAAPPLPPASPAGSTPAPSPLVTMGRALLLTATLGVLAKALGVLVLPGMVGTTSQRAIELVEPLAATVSYAFAALLAMLAAFGAFELSRSRDVGVVVRGAAIGLSGLVVALAAPSVVSRLQIVPSMALAIFAAILAGVAAIATLRAVHTRMVGVVLGMLALAALLRPIAWEMAYLAGERASLGLYSGARALATIAVIVQALATLAAAAWLGTRSAVRGRLLANGAIVVAFALTYLAAHDPGDATPSTVQAVLHASLAQAPNLPLAVQLASIAAFLVPATILLALVAVVQRASTPAVLGVLALALLSQGATDVPLQALCIAAAAVWGILAMADPRTMWANLVAARQAGRPA